MTRGCVPERVVEANARVLARVERERVAVVRRTSGHLVQQVAAQRVLQSPKVGVFRNLKSKQNKFNKRYSVQNESNFSTFRLSKPKWLSNFSKKLVV